MEKQGGSRAQRTDRSSSPEAANPTWPSASTDRGGRCAGVRVYSPNDRNGRNDRTTPARPRYQQRAEAPLCPTMSPAPSAGAACSGSPSVLPEQHRSRPASPSRLAPRPSTPPRTGTAQTAADLSHRFPSKLPLYLHPCPVYALYAVTLFPPMLCNLYPLLLLLPFYPFLISTHSKKLLTKYRHKRNTVHPFTTPHPVTSVHSLPSHTTPLSLPSLASPPTPYSLSSHKPAFPTVITVTPTAYTLASSTTKPTPFPA